MIDLLDLDRWAREGFPYAWFAELRANAPVFRHPAGEGGFWVISRHEDVEALGRCPHILSSDADNGGVSGLGPGDELYDQGASSDASAGFGPDAKMLLTLDPPEHTAYRSIVDRAFTRSRMVGLEPPVRTIVTELLDALPAEVDATTELAMPLPMQVIADLIGAPRDDHDEIMRWGNELVAGTDPEYDPGPDGQLQAALGFIQYFNELRAKREAEPGDDLTSLLMRSQVGDEGLSPIRFTMFLFLLAAAGNETTRNAISHGLLAFAEHPDQWERLREDPGLIPSAVEEVLRWSSPIAYFRRNAIQPMELHGEQIAAGDVVTLWYPSANRDESVFDAPDTFDVGRSPNRHVTFGGGGPHFCLGAALARLELRVLLEELLQRVARIEQTGPVDRLRSNFLNGVKHLPLRLVPA